MLKPRSRTAAFLALVLVLSTACAGLTVGKSLIVSGEALDELGKTFVQTGHFYDDLLDRKIVTVEEYRAWAKFANAFRDQYPNVVAVWKLAKASRDEEGRLRVEKVIGGLRSELMRFALSAAAKIGG